MELLFVRIASLIAISLLYMLFDLFNKRNIPSILAYGGLAYGLLLTLLYLNATSIIMSFGIAAAVLAIGYGIYRAGMLGAGDVFEFATLSLVLPFQSVPLIIHNFQFGLPFIISLFLGSGIAALIMVPLYYIPRARSAMKKPIGRAIGRPQLFKAALVGTVYILFLGFLIIVLGTKLGGVILMAIVAVGSFSVILFEVPITNSMAKRISYKGFEEGDMVALNLMEKSEINRIKRHVHSFNRLITKRMIKEMKDKGARYRIPVYKNAIPLAAPIFIGTLLSILFGNLILLLLPF